MGAAPVIGARGDGGEDTWALGDRSAAAIEAAWVISGKYGSKRLRLLG
jgi:hypothetical protein